MKKRLGIFIFSLLYLLLAFQIVLAHPGRTDAYGCHTCRTNCPKWGLATGEYHCHDAKALPQPEEPVKSHYSETGGYTIPAPEYKQPAVIVRPPVQEVTPKKVEEIKVVIPPKKVEPVKPEVKMEVAPSQDSWMKKLLKFLFG